MSNSSVAGRARALAKAAALAAIIGCSAGAHAGVDLNGVVTQLQVAPNGSLWFGLGSVGFGNVGSSTPTLASFCAPSWMGLSLTVPPGDPNFAYYYGLLGMSLSKAYPIYLGNISTFNGSTSCDITKTGYGIVLSHP